ncbi:hypothetical protein [Natronobacterium gregoryi]|uniref:Uncharacterized protein n=2 Tax=Natronobacterium gregoryi TaxID=44930 RepID=L0AMH4_NATGS|nr:hypothetical protein [Natronobacterium gregoryi]AFZ74255.1 hypothetical protein Natgr_3124 [Natronobacterium gregoryi SP2]ELY63713.1 hypothetical protein C490_15724 [Natronobacterium gregoryi SP2]PLK21961.1 hypothetical protein CYV19_00750 [Natronobacterium gregoryi SP2]SFI52448.1 hypothetical protein SAMN05443661_101143 [Natronobacterium gregoryi]
MPADSDFDSEPAGNPGDRTTSNRRQFLALSGLGVTGLAGCTERLNDDNPNSDSPTTDQQATPSSDEHRTVTMVVQPDPTALREAQLEITTAHEEGELDHEEAERELAERERELIDAAVDDAHTRVDDVGATVLDAVESEGALLVEGEPIAIVDLLEAPSISAMFSASRFEQAQKRDEASEIASDGADTDPAGTETNESTADSDGTE